MMPAVESFIANYGFIVIFFGAILEGETVVVMAGFLSHNGPLNPFTVMLAAFLGSMAGDQGIFMIGRRFSGTAFVRKQTERPLFATLLSHIEKNPNAFILSFRFLYGLRTVSPLAVGVSAVPAPRFFLLNTISAAVWAVVMTGIGYLLSRVLHVTLDGLPKIEHKVVAAFGVAVIAVLAMHLLSRAVRQRRGSAAAADQS
jgi:membrane protein DedA with SNARE-associated domain